MQDHDKDICKLRAEMIKDNTENKNPLNIILKLKDHITEHDLKVQKLGESSLTATTLVNLINIALNRIFKQLKVEVT